MKQEAIAAGPGQVLRGWPLEIDVAMVLRGQGADAAKIRARNPRAVAVAEQALREGKAWIDPRVVYRRVAVRAVRHERVLLEATSDLTGPLVAHHLASAQHIFVVVATIGEGLDARISNTVKDDLPLGLALEGFGNAAMEALAVFTCRHLGDLAGREGMRATIPLSPGMTGWKVDVGQRQIFHLLDASSLGVQLDPSCLMTPRKSLSMVLGFGRELRQEGRICDFCSLQKTCRYKMRDAMPLQSARNPWGNPDAAGNCSPS